jgi:hypothetical protein
MKIITGLVLILFISAQILAQKNDFKQSLKDNSVITNKVYPDLSKKSKEKDFSFSINPYLWTTATGGSFALPETDTYYFDLPFTDAVTNLQMAAMVAGRFKYKSVSLLYDVVYVNLKPELSVPVYTGYISGTSDVKQTVGDISLGYRLPIKNKNIQLDFYGGARIWSFSNKLDLVASNGQTKNTESSKSWADPIVGTWVNFILSDHWFSYVKGDIGGFGAASDWTSVFMWGFGYKFAENWNTTLGFKRMYIDYSKDKFIWSVSQYGLLISIGCQF